MLTAYPYNFAIRLLEKTVSDRISTKSDGVLTIYLTMLFQV
jgi:hypothetical protein